jgi:hypothetical protein
MTPHGSVVFLLAAAAGAAAAVHVFSPAPRDVAPATTAADTAAPLPAPPEAEPVQSRVGAAPAAEPGAAPAAAPEAAVASGSMRYPDGSSRPALNGVTQELVIPWPSGRPWSPVVEQLTHGGTEWCRHADGSFSTTVVRVETVSGKELQIPLCYTPSEGQARPSFRGR